jgi:hypothetical protein
LTLPLVAPLPVHYGDYGLPLAIDPGELLAVDTTAHGLARQLMTIIAEDRDRYDRIDRYVNGNHDDPYMPVGADAEYHLLARRSVTNLIPLIIGTPAQNLYVDSVRAGSESPVKKSTTSPAWKHWQNSRLDGRQLAVHRGALKYGHSFTLTEVDRKGRIMTKGLSAYHTAAVYEDPANDIDPFAALTITRQPDPNAKTAAARLGKARLWDGEYVYDVVFESLADLDSIRVLGGVRHGLDECPVTRFSASVDLEGRTTGVVEPNISIQDRINQTVFDLLVAQTYGSFTVRTVTGMAPPIRRWSQAAIDAGYAPEGVEAGDPVIDPDTGQPVPAGVNLNAKRWMFSEDPNAEFGSLPGTSLEGYIKSLDMSIRHLSVVTQTPPHYLLGEIANLSAEALQAAETSASCARSRSSRSRSVSPGSACSASPRSLPAMCGSAEDYAAEVIWRDTAMQSLSRVADGLVKLKELGIPPEGLFHRVPEATRNEIENWLDLRAKRIAELKAIRAECSRLAARYRTRSVRKT